MDINEVEVRNAVYCFMDEATNTCKIGLSGNPKQRIRSLQNSNPVKLSFIVRYVDEMGECEKYLHRRFCRRRIHGEWFKGVSFDEFNSAFDEYMSQKSKQRIDSLAFYNFLYDTDYESDFGVTEAVHKKMTIREYKIMVFIGSGVEDAVFIVNKLNNAVVNIENGDNITLLTYGERTRSIVKSYTTRFRKNFEVIDISKNYYADTGSFIEVYHETLRDCFGIIILCTEKTYFTEKITEYSKSIGVKVKTCITEPKQESKHVKFVYK